jgi:hypothetical protein
MCKKWNLFKYLDMYGQPIQFSYYGSSKFTSSCGLIVSLIVIFLMTYFSLCLIASALSFSKPRLYSITETFMEPPKFGVIPDFPGYFDSTEFMSFDKETDYDTIDLSFGLRDLNYESIPFDPSYFSLNFYQYSRNETEETLTPLFYDMCHRFGKEDKEKLGYYAANYSYCLYSPFRIQGNDISQIEKKLIVQIEPCFNNTYYKIPDKENIEEYQRLKYINDNFIVEREYNYKIFFDSFSELKENVKRTVCEYQISVGQECSFKDSEENIEDGIIIPLDKSSIDDSSKNNIINDTQASVNYTDSVNTTINTNINNTNLETTNRTNNNEVNSTNFTNNNETSSNSTSDESLLRVSSNNLTKGGTDTSYSHNYLRSVSYLSDQTRNSEKKNGVTMTSGRRKARGGNNDDDVYVNLRDLLFENTVPYVRKMDQQWRKQNNSTDDYKGMEILKCAPKEDIFKKIKNTRLMTFYTKKEFNSTNPTETVSSYMNYIQIYLSINLLKSLTVTFSMDEVTSYFSLIPPSFGGLPTYVYFPNIVLDTEHIHYSDRDLGEPIFKMNIQSSLNRSVHTRSYIDIFEILGLIGGISKVVFTIGLIFVVSFLKIEMKQVLINEFFSLIEPKKLKELERNFEEFLLYNKHKSIEDNLKILFDRLKKNKFDYINSIITSFFHNLSKYLESDANILENNKRYLTKICDKLLEKEMPYKDNLKKLNDLIHLYGVFLKKQNKELNYSKAITRYFQLIFDDIVKNIINNSTNASNEEKTNILIDELLKNLKNYFEKEPRKYYDFVKLLKNYISKEIKEHFKDQSLIEDVKKTRKTKFEEIKNKINKTNNPNYIDFRKNLFLFLDENDFRLFHDNKSEYDQLWESFNEFEENYKNDFVKQEEHLNILCKNLAEMLKINTKEYLFENNLRKLEEIYLNIVYKLKKAFTAKMVEFNKYHICDQIILELNEQDKNKLKIKLDKFQADINNPTNLVDISHIEEVLKVFINEVNEIVKNHPEYQLMDDKLRKNLTDSQIELERLNSQLEKLELSYDEYVKELKKTFLDKSKFCSLDVDQICSDFIIIISDIIKSKTIYKEIVEENKQEINLDYPKLEENLDKFFKEFEREFTEHFLLNNNIRVLEFICSEYLTEIFQLNINEKDKIQNIEDMTSLIKNMNEIYSKRLFLENPEKRKIKGNLQELWYQSIQTKLDTYKLKTDVKNADDKFFQEMENEIIKFLLKLDRFRKVYDKIKTAIKGISKTPTKKHIDGFYHSSLEAFKKVSSDLDQVEDSLSELQPIHFGEHQQIEFENQSSRELGSEKPGLSDLEIFSESFCNIKSGIKKRLLDIKYEEIEKKFKDVNEEFLDKLRIDLKSKVFAALLKSFEKKISDEFCRNNLAESLYIISEMKDKHLNKIREELDNKNFEKMKDEFVDLMNSKNIRKNQNLFLNNKHDFEKYYILSKEKKTEEIIFPDSVEEKSELETKKNIITSFKNLCEQHLEGVKNDIHSEKNKQVYLSKVTEDYIKRIENKYPNEKSYYERLLLDIIQNKIKARHSEDSLDKLCLEALENLEKIKQEKQDEESENSPYDEKIENYLHQVYKNKIKKYNKLIIQLAEDKWENSYQDKKNLLEIYFNEKLTDELFDPHVNIVTKKRNEIIYETIKQKMFSHFKYSYWEILRNLCCCCCRGKELKDKNKLFNKAWTKFNAEADFKGIFYSVKNFHDFRKALFDKSQNSLLQSLRNDLITGKSSIDDLELEEGVEKEMKKLQELNNSLNKLAHSHKSDENLNSKLLTRLIGSNHKEVTDTYVEELNKEKKKEELLLENLIKPEINRKDKIDNNNNIDFEKINREIAKINY